MIQNVLNHIGGVGIFGVISICIFFAFFTGMLLWAIRLKKSYLASMRHLPLETDGPCAKDGCDCNRGGSASPNKNNL